MTSLMSVRANVDRLLSYIKGDKKKKPSKASKDGDEDGDVDGEGSSSSDDDESTTTTTAAESAGAEKEEAAVEADAKASEAKDADEGADGKKEAVVKRTKRVIKKFPLKWTTVCRPELLDATRIEAMKKRFVLNVFLNIRFF